MHPQPKLLHDALTANDLPGLSVLAKAYNLDYTMLTEVLHIQGNYRKRGCFISLVQAVVIQGYYKLCKRLIQEGCSVLSSEFNTPPPLILALQSEKYQIARLLIQSGANVSLGFKGNTPMFYAIKKNTPEFIVEEILRAGFPVNELIEGTNGMTSLHRAVACDNVPIVNLLIERGADVNATDTLNLYRPLHVAVNQGCFNTVDLLVKKGASLEAECKEGYTPLFHAILSNNIKLVKKLDILGADFHHLSSVKMIYPLNFAVSLGRREITQYLVLNGAGVLVECPVSGNLPIHDVALSQVGKKVETFRLELAKITTILIDNGSDLEPVNKQGLTPLQLALREQNFNVVEVLVREGVNINKEMDQATYFHFVAKFARSDVVEAMLECGADWSIKDKNGMTSYHWAKLNPNVNALQMFFKHRCPLDLPTAATTPLKYNYSNNVISVLSNQNLFIFGIRKGDVQLVKEALSKGAVARGISCEMRNPLHFAVENGSSAVVLLMLEQGVSPNDFDEEGETPLHAAARKGDFLICIYLLSYGAGFSTPAKKSGKTPLDLAMENAKFKVVFLLKEIQAEFSCQEDRYVRSLDEKLKSWQADSRLLLAFLNSVNSRGDTLMRVALRKRLYKLAYSIMKFHLHREPLKGASFKEKTPKGEPTVQPKSNAKRWKRAKKLVRIPRPNPQPIQQNIF